MRNYHYAGAMYRQYRYISDQVSFRLDLLYILSIIYNLTIFIKKKKFIDICVAILSNYKQQIHKQVLTKLRENLNCTGVGVHDIDVFNTYFIHCYLLFCKIENNKTLNIKIKFYDGEILASFCKCNNKKHAQIIV